MPCTSAVAAIHRSLADRGTPTQGLSGLGLPRLNFTATNGENRREMKSIHRACMNLNAVSRLLLPSLLLVLPALRAQPWSELGTSYDIAAFEPVSPAIPGLRETIFLGHGVNDLQGQPSEPVNFMGGGFTVADVNGDGRNDLIVSSPRANFPNRNHSGSVWIWFGNGTTGIRDAAGLLGTPPNVRIIGADAEDGLTWLGNSGESNSVLSAGDCTGDGIADIVLHSQEASGPGNTRPRSGEAYLFFGRSTWPAVIDLANPTAAARADVVVYGESQNLLGHGTGGSWPISMATESPM